GRRLFLGERVGAAPQLPRLRERQHLDDAAPLLARVAFDGGEAAMVAGLGDSDADGECAPAEVRGLVAQQLKRIERAVLGIAAVCLVTLPARDREHVTRHARGEPDTRPYGTVWGLEQQDGAVGDL